VNRYYFHVDAGHGWLAVKRSELKRLEILHLITGYSYQRGGTVYLEEDCDVTTFLKAKKEAGEEVTRDMIKERYQERSPVRSYESYTCDQKEVETV